MVGVGKAGSEIARISAVDCLTGRILVDRLVQPTRPVTQWRTRVSGITKKAMEAAVANKSALKGWPAARLELWKYIDSATILIGHALHNDLKLLRMQHWRIIDSSVLASLAMGPDIKRQWGLKVLCRELLDIAIQTDPLNGHNSVEDALAAREVVLWSIAHQDDLHTWGIRQRDEYLRMREIAKAKQDAKREAKKAKLARKEPREESEEMEVFSLEELAEEMGWPEGWDPWSD